MLFLKRLGTFSPALLAAIALAGCSSAPKSLASTAPDVPTTATASLPAGAPPTTTAATLIATGPDHPAPTPLNRDRMRAEMNAVFAPLLKKHGAQVSAEVRTLDGDQLVYALNPELALTPASTIKLFTAYAALKKLGPAATFKTSLYTDGKNLYLRGGGDPSLVTERFFLLASQSRLNGLPAVRGKLYIDQSLFDPELRSPVRIDQDSDRAYNAPVTALSLNYNAMTVHVHPGDKVGAPALASIDPEGGYARLSNAVRTVPAGRPTHLHVSREEGDHDDNRLDSVDALQVTGQIAVDAPDKEQYLNVAQSMNYAGQVFCRYLNQQGVKMSCDHAIRAGKVPPEARLLAEQESPSVGEIVRLMNKYSNNFIAESLAKSLSPAEIKTTEGGLETIRAQLSALGLNPVAGGSATATPATLQFASASGLSRLNRVSAHDFDQALVRIAQDFSVFPEFLASLPLAHADGTLKKRFKNYLGPGVIRAKSGSIDGARALAGYAQRKDGQRLVFSLVINGAESFDENGFAAALLQDEAVSGSSPLTQR